MTTSGIVAGNQVAIDNVLTCYVPTGYVYNNGATFVFTAISSSGPNPACSLNTSTGVFTCNYPGTYIICATPYLAAVSSGTGITGQVFVNGALYHTNFCSNGNASFAGTYLNVVMQTMIYDTNPGTTFNFVITNTVVPGGALTVQSGRTGSWAYVLYFA